ncbi:MAG: ECF-type sigma factor [Gemmatimonadota bacterium]
MDSPDPVKVHELLTQVREGDREALDRLIPLVYDELEELARVQRRRWHGTISVHTGSLLNEAYMRLAGQESPQWRDRAHFMAVAATAMRQILIDHARSRGAKKRGGDQQKINFDELEGLMGAPSPQLELRDDVLLLLDDCLSRLGERNARHMQIVECRFFAGMTIPETAEALGVSPATVKRGWAVAQAWLYREMRGEAGEASET